MIVLSALSPFLRSARSHWGVGAEVAARSLPGDELVPTPRWGWTHGVEIDAPAAQVWPWVAQIGADRGGFYSYQWLENVVGCEVRNAEAVHPEWQVRPGDSLVLSPGQPPMPIVELVPGSHFVAHGAPDDEVRAAGRPWVAVTWLLLVEPLGPARCRFISRFRSDSSHHLVTRAAFGPFLGEPVGFAMDRRMLLGVRERAERARRAAGRPA